MFSLLGDEIAEASGGFLDVFISGLRDTIKNFEIDHFLYLFGGIMLVYIIASAISLIWCYESRATRAIKKINKYLKTNSKITDSNLVEFHKQMRKLPRRMRDRWQLFMLEREGTPSKYMSVEYCVKRPLYNSAILSSQRMTIFTTALIALLAFLLCLVRVQDSNLTIANLLLNSLIVPVAVIVLGASYILALSLKYSNINHEFYDFFISFVRNVDQATVTMPDYVDYELLFTKSEIEKGVPVLREFLEKRAIEEQRLLEKSKREDANHSPYNFASLGVNGSQLIERAVTESEQFLLKKIAIQNEIDDYEKRLQKSDENMEEIQREANKKLQAIKENLERLDKAMSETTNRVEINYNRRQAESEMEKKNILEKDLENMLNKEKIAADAIKVEIQKRKEQIEENKVSVEDALKSEYDTFATRVYDELNEKIIRENAAQLHDLEMTIARLKAKIKEFTRDLEKKNSIIEARNLELDNMRQQAMHGKFKPKSKVGKEYIEVQQNEEEIESHRPMAQATRANGMLGAMPDVDSYAASDGVISAQNYDANQNANAIPIPVDVPTPDVVKVNIKPLVSPEKTAGFMPTLEKEDLKQLDKLESNYVEFNITPFAKSLKKEEPKQEQEAEVKEEKVEAKPAEKKPDKKDNSDNDSDATDSGVEAKPQPKKEQKEDKTEEKAAEEVEDKKHSKSVQDLNELQDKIAKENKKLKKQQEELREQIDQTLASMEQVSNVTKQQKAENIKKIRAMISKLKAQTVEAKAKGSSKEEISKINQSVANLLKVLAEYQSTK